MGLFGSENSRNIKRLKKIADKVVALEDEFKKKQMTNFAKQQKSCKRD